MVSPTLDDWGVTPTNWTGDSEIYYITCTRIDEEYDIKVITPPKIDWYVPRKTPIKTKSVKKYINIQIRNSLPYKRRAVDNIL